APARPSLLCLAAGLSMPEKRTGRVLPPRPRPARRALARCPGGTAPCEVSAVAGGSDRHSACRELLLPMAISLSRSRTVLCGRAASLWHLGYGLLSTIRSEERPAH